MKEIARRTPKTGFKDSRLSYIGDEASIGRLAQRSSVLNEMPNYLRTF
jgi:hypothetical protein